MSSIVMAVALLHGNLKIKGEYSRKIVILVTYSLLVGSIANRCIAAAALTRYLEILAHCHPPGITKFDR